MHKSLDQNTLKVAKQGATIQHLLTSFIKEYVDDILSNCWTTTLSIYDYYDYMDSSVCVKYLKSLANYFFIFKYK